jgi:hypothetical protein
MVFIRIEQENAVLAAEKRQFLFWRLCRLPPKKCRKAAMLFLILSENKIPLIIFRPTGLFPFFSFSKNKTQTYNVNTTG